MPEPEVIEPQPPEPEPQPPPPEPEPPPPPPDPNVVDESGVPWKNRAMEMQRKYQEALERAQYQPQPPRPPQAAEDDLEPIISQFAPEVQKPLRAMAAILQKKAERTADSKAYQFVTKMTQQQELADPALRAEAEKQYAVIKNNPAFHGSEEVLTQLALAQAKVALAARAPQATRVINPPPPQAPPTRGNAPPSPANDKETYIKGFLANPQNIQIAKKIYGPKFNPDNPEGQRKLREAAEIEFNEGGVAMWGGGVKSAVEAIMRDAQRSGK